MPFERELKLTGPLPDLSLVLEIAGFALNFSHTERQTNTYFDTPTATLRSAGITLRLRQLEGGAGVYTYKGQGSVLDGWHQKTELEQDAGNASGLEHLNDPEIVQRVSSVAALTSLEPAFCFRTTRQVYDLEGVGELALDDVTILNANLEPIESFTETELEIKHAASDADVQRIEAALRMYPNLEPSRLSKSARALGALIR
jgi:inorganic triphosphatase YgiF